jgi:hypothetical protein
MASSIENGWPPHPKSLQGLPHFSSTLPDNLRMMRSDKGNAYRCLNFESGKLKKNRFFPIYFYLESGLIVASTQPINKPTTA